MVEAPDVEAPVKLLSLMLKLSLRAILILSIMLKAILKSYSVNAKAILNATAILSLSLMLNLSQEKEKNAE